MGGNLSVQSGGARPIKTIKDEIAARMADEVRDDALLERLSAELDSALASKKNELETGIEQAIRELNDAKKVELSAELQALIEGEPDKPSIPNTSINAQENTDNEEEKEEEELNENTKAKLEKCKEREITGKNGETKKEIKETQESIKKDVPGFFSTFFGNWFSYDNWQSTPAETEAIECKDLLAKYGDNANKGAVANLEEANNSNERSNAGAATAAVNAAPPTPKNVDSEVGTNIATATNVTEGSPVTKEANGNAQAKTVATSTVGGRRRTHKNREKRNKSHKASRE